MDFLKLLKPLLMRVTSESPQISDVNVLVKIAHKIAIARLVVLKKSNRLPQLILSNNYATLAIDAIAELFRRDNEGAFVDLQFYFRVKRDINEMSDGEAVSSFRSLVFTLIGDCVIRSCQEADPIFGKILRNMKNHIRRNDEIKTMNRFGTIFIYTCDEGGCNAHLPEMPIELLESEFLHKIISKDKFKDYPCIILSILNEQNEFRKFYSILDVALIIKKTWLKLGMTDIPNQTTDFNWSIQSDVMKLVQRGIEEFEKKFFGNGFADMNEKFFVDAIREIIHNTFIKGDGFDATYFEILKKHNPQLEYIEYRKHIRVRFEYLAKSAKKIVHEHLKDLL